ncbi:unnamed protein product [Rotaria socialis]|nr:unnamed protein product [Rotaria socialis]CAF3731833.1 unnamed protein product [Rotaria socialis]
MKPNEIQFNQLRNIIDYVQVFDNIDICNKYIEQITDDHQIYIVTNIQYNSNKAQMYTYENNFNEIIDSIDTDHNTRINPLSINIFKQSTHSQLNSEFLWFQRILAVLLDNDDREKAKKNFIDSYKKYFEGNQRKEEKIQLFENTYRSENALQWYSRECFFYDILNKALRTQDIDVLYSLRFFLKDMYEQLKIEYNKTCHEVDLFTYRGQIISLIELENIKQNIGQLISLNSFISTTINEQIAEAFSSSGNIFEGEQVLFHIKVNKNRTNSKPFADISHLSQFIDEKEILFMAGSIFEIKAVTFSDSIHMWTIELELCDDDVYELNSVYQSERNIVFDQHSPFSLAAVLLRMNLFDKAKIYYQRLLDEGSINESSSIDLIVNCYWGLGNVNRKQGEYDISLAYYCLAIQLCSDRFDLLIRSYKYMSLVYLDIHSISEALEYQTKALEIQKKKNDAQDQIADTLYNLGLIHFGQLEANFSQILDYLLQALNIYKELHMNEDIIRCYDSLGEVYLRQKKKDIALKYHFEALKMIDEHYPTYLSHRINAYELIGKTYDSMRNYEQALKYYNDALNAKLKYEPLNDPNVADSYELIGGVFHKKGDYIKAIEMYDKSIEIRRFRQLESHPDVQSIMSLRNCLKKTVE